MTVAWGRSVLEPTRGHVRETHDGRPVAHDVGGALVGDGRPVAHDVGGALVGLALCGALLIDDLDPDAAAGDFDRCSVCVELLTRDPGD